MLDGHEAPPTDAWIARVDKLTQTAWAKQDWHHRSEGSGGTIELDPWGPQADSVGGIPRLIERRYPDFEDRVRKVAELVMAVATLVARPGHVTEGEYREHMWDAMRLLLPFLQGTVRETLTRRLIAEYATASSGRLCHAGQ